eukprot:COSAG05_NODE_420_length_9974_cov_12.733975_4_plen_60_part_00
MHPHFQCRWAVAPTLLRLHPQEEGGQTPPGLLPRGREVFLNTKPGIVPRTDRRRLRLAL